MSRNEATSANVMSMAAMALMSTPSMNVPRKSAVMMRTGLPLTNGRERSQEAIFCVAPLREIASQMGIRMSSCHRIALPNAPLMAAPRLGNAPE